MDIVSFGDRTDHIGCLALFLALHGDSWAKARSYLQRSLRGFSGFSRESSLKISLDRSSAIRGTRIFTSTYWSPRIDRKSTRLNSSHVAISYAVFCLKKKKKTIILVFDI